MYRKDGARPVDGVSRRRLRLAAAADIGDEKRGVRGAGGEVASGRQTRHLEPPMKRRVAVDLDPWRPLANHEQFVADRRQAPDRRTGGHRVEQGQARRRVMMLRVPAAHRQHLCTPSSTAFRPHRDAQGVA